MGGMVRKSKVIAIVERANSQQYSLRIISADVRQPPKTERGTSQTHSHLLKFPIPSPVHTQFPPHLTFHLFRSSCRPPSIRLRTLHHAHLRPAHHPHALVLREGTRVSPTDAELEGDIAVWGECACEGRGDGGYLERGVDKDVMGHGGGRRVFCEQGCKLFDAGGGVV